MRFKIKSKVHIDGIGTVVHNHEQEFEPDSNVFGRAYDYRQYMKRLFPECDFELISAEEIGGTV